MKKIIRFLLNFLCAKKINENKIKKMSLSVKKEDVTFFALSSNTILALNTEKGVYFFRECIPLTDNKTYIEQRINLFFLFLQNNDLEKINFLQKSPISIHFKEEIIDLFHRYLTEKVQKDEFIDKILDIDISLNKIGYSIWGKDNNLSLEQFADMGLTDLSHNLLDIARYFVWYIRGAAFAKKNSKWVRSDLHSFYNAAKAVSTGIVADALGLQHLVTTSCFCNLYIDEMELFGELCPMAEGIRAKDASLIEPTIELYRALSDLHILDTICFQQDHGPNNYNLVFSNNHPVSVCAFDNDNQNTFSPIISIKHSLAGCTPLVEGKGHINRPAISSKTATNLINLNIFELCKNLALYLNVLQICTLVIRIKKLCKAIRKTPDSLKDTTEWSENIIYRELQGTYGVTYFTKLIAINNDTLSIE